MTTEPMKVSAKRKETRERRCWIVGEGRNGRKGIYWFMEDMLARNLEGIGANIAYYCHDI